MNIPGIFNTVYEENIEEALKSLEKSVREAIPRIDTRKRKAKPWFRAECYRKCKEAINTLHNARAKEFEGTLQQYAHKRREYKAVIRETKEAHRLQQEKKLIEAAENDPFRALQPRQPQFSRDIPIET